MENKLTITLKVAGKILKPTIERKQEETFRKAAKLLDDKYNEYRSQVDNTFDCLLLSSLQVVINQMNDEQNKIHSEPLNKSLSEIEELLTGHLTRSGKK